MFEKLFKRKEKVRLKKCKKCGCEVNAAQNRELICPECGAYLNEPVREGCPHLRQIRRD